MADRHSLQGRCLAMMVLTREAIEGPSTITMDKAMEDMEDLVRDPSMDLVSQLNGASLKEVELGCVILGLVTWAGGEGGLEVQKGEDLASAGGSCMEFHLRREGS